MSINQPLAKKQPLYSYHAFLFPFEWSYRNEKSDLLEEQTDLGVITELMSSDSVSNTWQRGESWVTPKSLVQYNEVAYFYDFVRPILYDTIDANSLQRHYRLVRGAGVPAEEYVIATKEKNYRLQVDDITLSFFDTGVGVLSFHLLNKRIGQSSPEDILRINGLGRRIYPPFFVTDTHSIGTQAFFDDDDWEGSLRKLKAFGEIPDYIALEAPGVEPIKDDYTSWITDHNLDREPELVRKLLPSELLSGVKLKPVLDDRMFVVSYYGNDSISRILRKENGKNGEPTHLSDDWWYRYVFVDPGDRTVRNKRMTASLLNETTYTRWSDYGTFYGVARYSFVCLTQSMDTNSFGKVLASHTQTLYYKLSLLALVQRASLLRFSEEVTNISKLPRGDKRIANRVSSLYKQYIRFVNRVYFREVTAQEQGVELYDMLQTQMRLDGQIKDLDRELQELHQYVLIVDEEQRMREEEKRNEKLDLLTYFAAFFVVPGFITSYYGINDFKTGEYWWEISLMCAISSVLALAIVRVRGEARTVVIVLTIAFFYYVFFIFPSMYDTFKS